MMIDGASAALRTWLRAELHKLNSAHETDWILEYLRGQNLPVADIKNAAQEILLRRAQNEPLAYIFGSWAFRDHEFLVGPGVLVPRPETEEVVEVATRELASVAPKKLRVLDLGAGSGCIGLSFAADLQKQNAAWEFDLILCESSPQARRWLESNVAKFKNQFRGSVAIFAGDWSEWPVQPTDVIFSNPPYLTAAELVATDESVQNFEPHSALVPSSLESFADASGPYREIIDIAQKSLRPEGWLFLELGVSQAEWIMGYIGRHPMIDTKIHSDMSGKARIFCARKGSHRG